MSDRMFEGGSAALRVPALAGVVGPAVFVAGFVIAGLVRPGYSPVQQSISALGVGPDGLLERATAVVGGLLVVVFAAAFAVSVPAAPPRWLGGVLLALPGIGLAASGVFTAARPTTPIHSTFSVLGLVGGAAAFVVVGLALRRSAEWRAWGAYSLVAGVVTAALLAVEFLAANPRAPLARAPFGGLVERILVVELLAWYVAFGVRGLVGRRAA